MKKKKVSNNMQIIIILICTALLFVILYIGVLIHQSRLQKQIPIMSLGDDARLGRIFHRAQSIESIDHDEILEILSRYYYTRGSGRIVSHNRPQWHIEFWVGNERSSRGVIIGGGMDAGIVSIAQSRRNIFTGRVTITVLDYEIGDWESLLEELNGLINRDE